MNYKDKVQEIFPDAFCIQEESELNYWIFEDQPKFEVFNAIGVGVTEEQAWEDAFRGI